MTMESSSEIETPLPEPEPESKPEATNLSPPNSVEKPSLFSTVKQNKWLVMASLLAFLTLLFFILYIKEKNKIHPCPECPPAKPCPPLPTCPTCPTCPACPICPHPEWKLLSEGQGFSDQGDPGKVIEITQDTNTLEKAQKWVLAQKGQGLSYPKVPCMVGSCNATSSPATTSTSVPMSVFYYSNGYSKTIPDPNYQTFVVS